MAEVEAIENHGEGVETASAPMRITVCAGEMSFSPVQYHTFKVGAVFVSSDVNPDEAADDCAARLREVALKSQRDMFLRQRDLFWRCYAASKNQPQPQNAQIGSVSNGIS